MEPLTQPTTFDLNPDVAEHFDLEPGTPPVFEHHTHGTIDIRTVAVSVVVQLILAGVKYFTKKITGDDQEAAPAETQEEPKDEKPKTKRPAAPADPEA